MSLNVGRWSVVAIGMLLLSGCGDALEAGDVAAGAGLDEGAGDIGEAAATAAESASALASGTADLNAWCGDVVTWNQSYADFESQVLTLVNQKRAAGASCGGTAYAPAPALTLDDRLRCAARKHSKDMGVNDFMSHTGSDGSTPWARMTSAGYTYTQAAENVAAGYPTPAAVVDGWMASTGHCQNIMKSTLKHLGVGYYYAAGSTYGHYWTQDFGRP